MKKLYDYTMPFFGHSGRLPGKLLHDVPMSLEHYVEQLAEMLEVFHYSDGNTGWIELDDASYNDLKTFFRTLKLTELSSYNKNIITYYNKYLSEKVSEIEEPDYDWLSEVERGR